MATGDLQGWHADPFQLHEERYFSAGTPTKLVRDGRAESYDEPPSGSAERPSGSAEPPSGPGQPPSGPREPAVAAAAATGAGSAPAGQGQPAAGYAAAAPYAPPARYAPPATYAGYAPEPRRRPVAGVFMGTTLIAAAAVIAVIVATTVSRPAPAPPRGGLSLAAYVTQSAQKTLAERTVSMTLTGTFSVAGKRTVVHGAGQVDYTADAMALDFSYSLPGGTTTVREIMVNGTGYASVIVNGKVQAIKDGRHWMSVSTGRPSVKSSFAEDDPFAELAAIAKAGHTTVREIGTRGIGGVRCAGYTVTVQDASFTLWIDPAGLVREMSIGMQMSVGVQGSSTVIGGSLVMDFTKYGVPVHITRPAPSDTTSL